MSAPKSIHKLSKFLHYLLGCRPDEFGLVPDADGYVTVKELLKALAEEDGWRHVRRSHLNEILLTVVPPGIEIDTDRIRAASRDKLPRQRPAENVPKLLYACIRPRAQPVIMRHGLTPSRLAWVVLAADPSMAERIGKRIHPSPVMLTVHTAASSAHGVHLVEFGEGLYLADHIPTDCISAPPLPKEPAEDKKPPTPPPKMPPRHPGSVILDEARLGDASPKSGRPPKKRKGKDIDWKRDRKRIRREKERFW